MSSIPLDEATFYEHVASKEADELSSMQLIDQLSSCSSESVRCLVKLLQSDTHADFPNPKGLWLSATYDCLAEWDAYNYLAPLRGKRVLQIGGKGHAAIQFMVAGADEAWLLTPIEGEARYAKELARLAGVKIDCKIGVAENIPFDSNMFDAIYCGGCAHHFETEKAFPEISRILAEGGRFSAIEPWRAPLYSLGIRFFGKREKEVNCKPLTPARLAPLMSSFPSSQSIQHGTITRYALLALLKLGIVTSLETVWRITQVDDRLSSILGLRRWGSSVAVLAEKSARVGFMQRKSTAP